MSKRYVLNTCIEFYPEKCQLSACENKNMTVKLHAPVSRCLELLIERRYELVPQQDFYPYVWGSEGKQVPVSTLYQSIALLRKALKTFQEEGDKIVNTVPKQGFSLHPDVTVQEILGDLTIESIAVQVTNKAVVTQESLFDESLSSLPPVAVEKETMARKRLHHFLLPAGILALAGLLAYQLTQWDLSSPTLDLSQYSKIGEIAECQVYANRPDSDMANANVLISANRIDCSKKTYLYITNFQYSEHQSLLLCDRSLDDASSPKCQAYNFY
ncbi:winged helix-turn-helix domain-containing protein [Serratia fonticola]|jgi:DNA-binding winged helix-turn-helix (wHTH) protein|uniref:winged helix-turn-helix domain-containing protein n=1 Tax=Serratia fonticola TaxID=47917 RepID=UPI0021790430|nr:winged helix-turn-helix domain-containing protein [Serratia fonticola]CAI0876536.1 Transcriptional regulatory protein, C terminal [Serratia fonticola]CAI0912448.1 Transcriptional regulatory protein, C terminal [Serratia fonticola]CAI1657945.1 Transcriptional regulatory protein, C terminal [Serratia fonticola]CAI1873555.1 Transcriptional regulatory protein, C terminal [Serratia fonticola]CAI1884095.1 Transcriptional regulatory protein, C terminal [Serratia fonticola]